MACIEARGLRKAFGTTVAVDGVDLRVEEGRILGLIGPNGAGKTTALNAILGLTPYQGELRVLGRDPWIERDLLMRDVCFIADVAVLPRWIRVSQALDYVAGVHPRFDRAKAEGFHRGCCRAAALDSGLASARLRGGRASAIRSREGGRFFGEDHDQAQQQGEGIVEGHGGATAPCAGDGH